MGSQTFTGAQDECQSMEPVLLRSVSSVPACLVPRECPARWKFWRLQALWFPLPRPSLIRTGVHVGSESQHGDERGLQVWLEYIIPWRNSWIHECCPVFSSFCLMPCYLIIIPTPSVNYHKIPGCAHRFVCGILAILHFVWNFLHATNNTTINALHQLMRSIPLSLTWTVNKTIF